MFYTNTNNTNIQQAGADINTSIHDHLLHKAVWTQNADTYQLIRSHRAPKGSSNWLTNLVARLIGNAERPFANVAQATR